MRLPNIDMISFWIGAAVATVVWWGITLMRPVLAQMLAGSREKGKQRQLQASAGIEDTHRKIVYKQTQEMHLAASLFALDEIAQAPRLLAPPPRAEPGIPLPRQDASEASLPYLPAWPELGCIYRAPSLTIPQALAGGMNLIIIGQPGAGKTVALASLASQIVNRAPQVAALHQSIPFLVHVADLGLPLTNVQRPENLLAPIAALLSERASVFEAGRMPNFVQYAFQSGRALLLLDGVDELPQPAVQEAANYLRTLLKSYPQARVITTAGPEFADGIPGLGFAPMSLMPWSAAQQNEFLRRWTELWDRYVAFESWAGGNGEPIDAALLNRWLASDNLGLTPLEFTLKVWAAFAGDVRGGRAVDAIEAHLQRLLPQNAPREALHVIGAQASLNAMAVFDSRQAREWTKSFEPADATDGETSPEEAVPVEAPEGETVEPEQPSKDEKKSRKKGAHAAQSARPSLIGQLVANGILATHAGNRLRFAHPLFMGYLAGRALGGPAAAETLLSQPAWSGQTTAMRYVAAFSDATALVNGLLASQDPLLMRPTLTAARFLRDAPRNSAWRTPLMTALVGVLQNEDQPQGVRGQVMAAFALSGDPNIPALFRQLMTTGSNELQRFSALGAGVLADPKAVEALAGVITQGYGPARQAACLALVQVGSSAALEAVATALLRGDEQLRIAAAEALANHPAEGQEALREGIGSEDILVRRAIVYGLARVDESWARQLVERVQVEDEQWVVRNAAVEVMDARQQLDPHTPRRLTPPAETPWLIEFAGKHGQGVTPGAPATDILLLAFKDEDEDVRDAAISYLRYTPNEGVLSAFYHKFYGAEDPGTREILYQALWDVAYSGTVLPNPMQFGLGG